MEENNGDDTGGSSEENPWKYNKLLLECGGKEQAIPHEALQIWFTRIKVA